MIKKVYFIMHSCFVVEMDDRYLMFDYFDKYKNKDLQDFDGVLPELDPEKKLYVFSSHGHRDHWDISCLKWTSERKGVTYILSKHIRLGHNYLVRNGIDPSLKKKICFVAPMEKYTVDDMEIETLRSTDEGVAYIVTVGGQTIYHAGDLHWWAFSERGEIYCETIGAAYRRAIASLKDRHIDVAFVVLDSHLPEDTYYYGMDFFLKNVNADIVFPMHMWGRFDLIKDYKGRPDIEGRLLDKVVEIERENMCFEFDA